MIIEKLILERKDLQISKLNSKLNEIGLFDFNSSISREMIKRSNFITFLDNDGEEKILKSKYKIEQ